MVKCDEAASSSRLVLPYMFHLPGSEQDTASVYSTYKQRIDSMFDESRSCYSGAPNSSDDFRLQNNAVQARIEKMFVEMARTASSDTHEKARVKMSSTLSSTGGRNFPVRYLGSVGLSQKVTSLEGLQEPLKDLYFKYRRVLEDKGPESNPWGRGTLEISNCGLKVSHRGLDGIGDIEQLNPFSTIAVWAAVKFLCRDSLAGQGVEYAFLPLIADPEAIDKGTLFKPLNKTEGKIIMCTYSLNPLTHHSPMFAVVMRKMGMSRQLECHGFVCDCPEDAIVIAANLYQALMSTMPLRKSCDNKNKNTHKPSNKNGVSYVSIGGSTINESNNDRHSIVGSTSCVSEVNNNIVQSKLKSYISNEISSPVLQNYTDEKARDDPNIIRANVIKIPPPVPVRPPRRNKKSSISSASEDGEEFFIPAPFRNFKENGMSSLNSSCRVIQCDADIQQNFQLLDFCNTSEIPIRRTVSDGIQLATEYRDFGDILTKVAIPRSKSFLNAGGPFTRYSRRQKSGDFYTNESRGIGSSPLGFNELFAEFRVQEGLNSMDDILYAIIDAEGMSFNDLKPIYKEFLLKLAVTLTKDELYQRSKSIMRRQKKKLKRRNSCCKRNKTFVTGAGGLKRVFKRSVSKLRPSKTKLANFEFTSVLFPSGSIRESKTDNNCASLASSSISSCSTINYRHSRQVSSKVVGSITTRLPRRLSSRRRYQQLDEGNTFLSRHIQQPSTSEDSDFFSMVRSGGTTTANSIKKGTIPYGEMLNRSSSGYLTCSECSYDSESCTCTSADKCYCSLGEASGQMKTRSSLTPIQIKDASLSSCACDTDSCFDSDKCYCSGTPPHNNHHHHHHHHHLRDQGRDKTKSSEKNVLPIPKPDIKHHSINQTTPSTDNQVYVFEQLKPRGFTASESSLSRTDSPTTAWRKNEVKLTMSKKKDLIGSIKSTKSLEFLHLESLKNKHSPNFWGNSNNKCSYRQFHKRMDVYEPVPNLHRRSLSSQSKNLYQQRRSYSSDNLALDYDLFTSYKSEKNKLQASAMNPSNDQSSASKVLVVSARDPRGRVIYMGASCRSDDDQSYTDKHSSITDTNKHVKKGKEKGTASSACEALSVKKSAEIAALFSEVKLNQTKDNVLSSKNMDFNKKGDVFYNTLESPNCFLSGSTNHYLGSNLENSLGYLP